MEKIPGHPSNPELDPIKMVPGVKPNEYIFECEKCFEDTNNEVSK